MKQHRGQEAVVIRAARLRRDAERKGTVENLPLISPLPPLLQFRAGMDVYSVLHGSTGEALSFEIDPRHHEALQESLSQLPSPMHIPRPKRPIGVRLSEPAEFLGTNHGSGQLVVVEGIHRIAAAWALGRWRSIPINVIGGGQTEVDLLLTSANKEPVLAAKSHEDLFRSLRLHLDRNGVLPPVKQSAALLKVSERTIKRVRREYSAELGLGSREPDYRPDPVRVRYSPTQLSDLRSALKSTMLEAKAIGPEGASRVVLTALLNAPKAHREAVLEGLSRALDFHGIASVDIPNIGDGPENDDNPDF